MRTSLRILVTAAAAGSLLVPAGPASAETAATDDAAGDVWEVKFGEEGNPTWDPAGSVVNTDIVSTVVDHRPRRISFTTTYTDLVRSENTLMFVMHRMRFDEAPGRTLNVVRFSGARGSATISGPRKEIRCGGLSHEIDYAENTVTASFPRRCVGEPETLTYTSLAYSATGWETRRASDDRTYVDNGLGAGHGFRDFSEPLARG